MKIHSKNVKSLKWRQVGVNIVNLHNNLLTSGSFRLLRVNASSRTVHLQTTIINEQRPVVEHPLLNDQQQTANLNRSTFK